MTQRRPILHVKVCTWAIYITVSIKIYVLVCVDVHVHALVSSQMTTKQNGATNINRFTTWA